MNKNPVDGRLKWTLSQHFTNKNILNFSVSSYKIPIG